MRLYHCIIVDDETLAQDLIEVHLKKIPNIEVVAKCHTAMEAMAVLSQKEIDIMFLDIEMPDLTGIDFLKALENPPYTIFTTAYSEYALAGYELNVIDYLLKPIRFDRFFKAVSRALTLLKEKEPVLFASKDGEQETYLFVKSDYKGVKILYNEILYVESMQKYVRFHLKDKKPVVSLMSISSLAELLPTNQFFRCQKSFIVSMAKIESIDGNQVVLYSGHKVPVSRSLKSELLQLIDRHGLI
ncbi:LytTR family DNA-binding domain-containing protein [Roseivirga sp. E12]|uniref:LytR/AlgR family response regulator transcription factor n=1 Tax=Roseivirga sp. E12 TaxID=2819237 RepID=UPI001ABD34B6|nr:LytTR family DNA-binding domain-containing protein [Roseivirga sp. E12]MBO3697888.1 response regulator transcription factor [Roseivirga sp. E12]